jgi:hypothetical protein
MWYIAANSVFSEFGGGYFSGSRLTLFGATVSLIESGTYPYGFAGLR